MNGWKCECACWCVCVYVNTVYCHSTKLFVNGDHVFVLAFTLFQRTRVWDMLVVDGFVAGPIYKLIALN